MISDEPEKWTSSSEANAALIMLDRIDTTYQEDDDRIEGVKRVIRSLVSQLESQPVSQPYKLPDGWRLVPDEPTEEMMRAMHQAQDMWPAEHCDNMRETQMSFARPRYIAALATAPKPPTDSTT